jgi:hypothetical protein
MRKATLSAALVLIAAAWATPAAADHAGNCDFFQNAHILHESGAWTGDSSNECVGPTGWSEDSWIGAGGSDYLTSKDGPDTVNGGPGQDRIEGGDGADDLRDDSATGPFTTSNDFVFGGAGNDTLTGGRGADILHGDAGGDDLLNHCHDGIGDDIAGFEFHFHYAWGTSPFCGG